MKTSKPKKLRIVVPKKAAKPTKLSKSDPDYYKKIGQISAQKRKLKPGYFSDMAKKSHGPDANRDGYHGGRKPKTDK